MAYKFQRGEAILSGSLLQEGNVEIESGFQLIIGNAKLTEAELEQIDGVSAGTVAASKAVVVDSNKDASGFRNIGAAQLTTSGRVIVDDATEATSTTDGSLQTDGGLSVAKSAVIGDDLDMLSDAAILNFGADKDVNLTHVADTGLLLNSSMQFQFGDSGTYIHQSADGVLDLVADSEIEINATTVDINGAVDASSTITAAGRVIVDDATEATSTTDGSLQTDGGLSVAKSAVIGDDLDMLSDAAILNFGADKDVNLTHVADTGLLLNSSMQMQFGDSGTYIHQSADGVLDLVADTEIEINATTVDINGAVDASSTIVAASSITAGTSFIIGSADLNETDLEKLDGITNGTAAASKAVVLDANKDVSGLRDISGRKATLSSLTQGRLVTAGSSGLLEDQGELVYDDARSYGYLELRVSSSASGSAVVGDGYLNLSDAGENPMFQVSKYAASDAEEGLFFSDVAAPGAAAIATDVILFQDGSDDNRYKKEALGDVRDLFFGVVSGDATVAAGGALTIAADAVEGSMLNDNVISGQTELAHNGLAAEDELMISDGGSLKKIGVDILFADGPALVTEDAIDVATDYLLFLDGGATGDTNKESIADLVSAMAGAGLSATSGVLAVQGSSVALKANGDTLAEGYNYFADIGASDAVASVSLPAAPSVGDVVHVKAGDLADDKYVRISRQGSHTIDGMTSIDLESPFAAVSLVYVVADNWRIV